jgi:N-glycosylase/DNA lyase
MNYYSLTEDSIRINDFDLRHTIESAQPLTFQADYDFDEGMLDYAMGNSIVSAKFAGNSRNCNVRLHSDNINSAKKDFVKRFRLEDDMARIYSRIGTDSFMRAAVKNYHGMRVTLNDPWETTLCFIISQYNNVKRIRLIVKKFISEFGNEIFDDDGKKIGMSFPTSDVLAKFAEKDFRKAGAGFRAKYIVKAADYCTNNLDLYKLQSRGYDKVKESLMEVSGVGEKVADCIALMGYGKMEAFPIDVWVKRTLENVYFKGKEKSMKELHRFVEDRWDKGYRGYAQQYIFWHGRSL